MIPARERCMNRACGMSLDYRPGLVDSDPDRPRRAFIRDSAIQLAVAFRMRDPIVSMSRDDAKLAWEAALLLWAAKPEDC